MALCVTTLDRRFADNSDYDKFYIFYKRINFLWQFLGTVILRMTTYCIFYYNVTEILIKSEPDSDF